MAKRSLTEKHKRVLAAAQELFSKCDEDDNPPIINEAPTIIGEYLGMPPAEVAVLLRALHRDKHIGLRSGIGPNSLAIGRTQADLPFVRPVATSRPGRRGSFGRTSRDTPEEAPIELTAEERLQAEIERLNDVVADLQGKLTKSDRHRSNANNDRATARKALQASEENLREARATIQQLQAEIERLSTEASRATALEAELQAARSQHSIDPEVAEALRVYAAKRRSQKEAPCQPESGNATS